MTVHFEIRLTRSEGALIRTLGLIQRRGFNVAEMALRRDLGHQVLSLGVEANGRSPEVLARQLERLVDVVAVERLDREAWQATVVDCVRALASLLPTAESRPRVAAEAGR